MLREILLINLRYKTYLVKYQDMGRLIIIALFISCIGCKKATDPDNYPLQATMKTSSGKSVQAKFLETETKFGKGLSTQGDEIIVSGIKEGGEYSLTLVIIRPKVGTQDLSNVLGWNGSNCNAQIPYSGDSFSTWGIGSGKITIEALTDNSVKGSFNAVCIGTNDTLRITEGRFDGKFD